MQEFVGEWLERNNLSKLKPVFKGDVLKFEMNVRMIPTWKDFIFFSLALNNDKFLYENECKGSDIKRETKIQSSVLMKCSIKEALFTEFFFFVFKSQEVCRGWWGGGGGGGGG